MGIDRNHKYDHEEVLAPARRVSRCLCGAERLVIDWPGGNREVTYRSAGAKHFRRKISPVCSLRMGGRH